MEPLSALEQHFTAAELAELWHLDPTTIRRLFQNEPGVLRIANGRDCKRSYTTLRIPSSVAERVYRERCR